MLVLCLPMLSLTTVLRVLENVCLACKVLLTVTYTQGPHRTLEFVFSVQVPSIVLEFNSMFSNVLETKCLENAVILAVYWHKELNKFAHPTTSGKKRRDPNSCRTNARQPSAYSQIDYGKVFSDIFQLSNLVG